ncbi:phosphoribosylformylglycinamidine synthase [Candidatus Woesearchaeota archaeon]|nr:phosphoribosylformylglycinamidine synthase [Candidatus Woesearchaeota archaeon]
MHTIEVALKEEVFDGQGHVDSQRILDTFDLNADVQSRLQYVVDLGLSDEEAEMLAAELRHPVTQTASVNSSLEGDFDYVIRVSSKPGVMDTAGNAAKFLAGKVLGQEFPWEKKIAAQQLKFISSTQPLSESQLWDIAGLFFNPTVQRYDIFPAEEWRSGVRPYMPAVHLPRPEEPIRYDLDAMSDSELVTLSSERYLAMNLEEMQALREYLADLDYRSQRAEVGLTSKITDAELEAIAQTWSEHCKHKIFNADITYIENGVEERIKEGIFTRFIKSSTLAIQAQKPNFIKSVLWDNSGVVDLDLSLGHYFCFKCETHNSPSNMEPYGGALTGIVGVFRDPMGTGVGSKITFGLWGYITGSIFYDGDLQPFLHPAQLLSGVHRGVRDGGNKHGVPVAIGNYYSDPGNLGKAIVYVGAGGLIPREVGGRPGYEKTVLPGDRVVVVGGRVGQDGIHGATASSLEFGEDTTPAGHVQIGDPYTQKNVQEFMLEAIAEDLIRFAQDSGAGGIDSAAGEMATFSKGATIDLEKDLLKYDGLAAWEHLVSESQERMFLAVEPANLDRIAELAEKWNVEWRDIGEFNDSGYFHVRQKGKTVAYLDMKVLHGGAPQKKLRAVWQTPEERGLSEPSADTLDDLLQGAARNPVQLLHAMLRRENIASTEFLQREYDTRVQGRTIIPPLIGEEGDCPSDGFVQRVEMDKDIGVAVGIGLNPALSKIDTYHMAQYCANEGLMRVVAVGADPDKAANNGNYCWPGVLPEEAESLKDAEYKLAQLVRAAKGQHDFAMATGVATISGKDSMKVQGKVKDIHGEFHRIYSQPALQFATVATVPDVKKVQTCEFKAAGDLIYLVGPETKNELGASELYAMMGETGRNVPEVDCERSLEIYLSLHAAMQEDVVESCKVCSEGGIAVAVTQAAFFGGVGAKIHLDHVHHAMDADDPHLDTKLMYSNTASRFIVSVMPENQERFEELMCGNASLIGTVAEERIEFNYRGAEHAGDTAAEFKSSWQSTFRHKLHAPERL